MAKTVETRTAEHLVRITLLAVDGYSVVCLCADKAEARALAKSCAEMSGQDSQEAVQRGAVRFEFGSVLFCPITRHHSSAAGWPGLITYTPLARHDIAGVGRWHWHVRACNTQHTAAIVARLEDPENERGFNGGVVVARA